ncbi:52 kDa repressor of the inhibitor of the protein kinase-like [Palaemon carinicauda]|uniref:52 kDa repressor of the inhibitor of the protein kinase-like n=1 Tax=Palaemon carinicauda TaxID=392227 RepID=UPI0035B62693
MSCGGRLCPSAFMAASVNVEWLSSSSVVQVLMEVFKVMKLLSIRADFDHQVLHVQSINIVDCGAEGFGISEKKLEGVNQYRVCLELKRIPGSIGRDSFEGETLDVPMINEVTDTTSNKEVLSVCLRYLSGENQINILESFIDFVNLDRTTWETIADAILKSLTDNGYIYQNLRGQGYYGASALSSSRTAVNGRIRQVAPYAIYSHCQSHLLNLSIASSCKLPAVRNMIGSLNGVFLLFSNSPKRQSLFEKVLEQSDDYKGNKKKILSLCKTRWVERHDCFNTFHELYIPTVTTLEVILSPHEFTDIIRNEDWIWDCDTRTKARGLFSTMKSFEFVIAFYAAKQTLYAIRPIAVKLQRSDLDCYEAYNMVDSTIREIKDLRDSLDIKFSQWLMNPQSSRKLFGDQWQDHVQLNVRSIVVMPLHKPLKSIFV